MKVNFKRIIVTGGAGFIGSHLICWLLKETDSSIFNLDKLNYSSDLTHINLLLNEKKEYYTGRYNFMQVDLSNSNEIQSAIEFTKPDLIIHLAAESHVDRSIDGPTVFIESNIVGTFNLLQSALNFYRKLSLVQKEKFRFHHVSTDEVFGSLDDLNGKFNESTKYDPRSPYSASKACSDHLVNAWHHTFGLPVTTSNCSNNYGSWQYPEKLIPLTILKALSFQEIPVYGQGLNIRDWLHVSDHIQGLIKIVNYGEVGTNYCIGGNTEKSNLDVVKMICRYLDIISPKDKSYLDLISFVTDRPGHDFRYAINANKIKEILGWRNLITFEEGLKDTIDWYLQNQDWCANVMRKSNYQGQRIGNS